MADSSGCSEPTEHDVICGRGSNPRHKGNVYHKALVDAMLDRYQSAKKFEKRNLAKEVVEIINAGDPNEQPPRPPGRFMVKDGKDGDWTVMETKKAELKTSELFRYAVRVLNQNQKGQGQGQGQGDTSNDTSTDQVQANTSMDTSANINNDANDMDADDTDAALLDAVLPPTQLLNDISRNFMRLVDIHDNVDDIDGNNKVPVGNAAGLDTEEELLPDMPALPVDGAQFEHQDQPPSIVPSAPTCSARSTGTTEIIQQQQQHTPEPYELPSAFQAPPPPSSLMSRISTGVQNGNKASAAALRNMFVQNKFAPKNSNTNTDDLLADDDDDDDDDDDVEDNSKFAAASQMMHDFFFPNMFQNSSKGEDHGSNNTTARNSTATKRFRSSLPPLRKKRKSDSQLAGDERGAAMHRSAPELGRVEAIDPVDIIDVDLEPLDAHEIAPGTDVAPPGLLRHTTSGARRSLILAMNAFRNSHTTSKMDEDEKEQGDEQNRHNNLDNSHHSSGKRRCSTFLDRLSFIGDRFSIDSLRNLEGVDDDEEDA